MDEPVLIKSPVMEVQTIMFAVQPRKGCNINPLELMCEAFPEDFRKENIQDTFDNDKVTIQFTCDQHSPSQRVRFNRGKVGQPKLFRVRSLNRLNPWVSVSNGDPKLPAIVTVVVEKCPF